MIAAACTKAWSRLYSSSTHRTRPIIELIEHRSTVYTWMFARGHRCLRFFASASPLVRFRTAKMRLPPRRARFRATGPGGKVGGGEKVKY